MNYNHLSQISPSDLPSSLKILHLRGNLLENTSFLIKTTGLESLSLEHNALETLTDFTPLPSLNELFLANNKIFLLAFPKEIHEMFPNLRLLDLSQNSLYDRFELLTLSKIVSLFELDLTGNPCAILDDFIEKAAKDYPAVSVINNFQVSRGLE